MSRAALLWLIAALLVVGCSLLEQEEVSTPTPAETITIPTPVLTPTTAGTPVEGITPRVPPDSLNVWLTPGVSNDLESPGGRILSEQIQAFVANHPEIELDVSLKQPSGPGGTLSYLRTGRSVAPSILPDLIVLPSDQLSAAVEEELVYPLDDLLDQEMTADLFPAAESLAKVDGLTYGYPVALQGLEHLVYNMEVFTDTIPATWERVISLEEVSLALAGAGTPGGELALLFYLATGGRLTGDADLPSLDMEILTNALSQISRARLEGLIVPASNSLTTSEEAWDFFANGSTSAVITEARLYLPRRQDNPALNFARIPGVERSLSPLLEGWVWAISSPEPERQTLAAELIAWLAAGPNMGEWTLAAYLLPARRSAIEQWPEGDDYIDFITEELERASPLPGAVNDQVLTVLSTAVFDILSLDKTPQVAAGEVLASLQP